MDTSKATWIKEKNAAMRVSVITSLMTAFMGSALNLSIPKMGDYFDASATTVSWIITAYMLAIASMSVPFGKLADTTGRRRIFLLGIMGFTLSSGLAAIAWDMTFMLLLRVIQGLSAAMIFATNTAILLSIFPPAERGKALGNLTAGVYVGLSAGPVIGGMLNHYLGWQSIFLVSSGMGIIALAIAFLHLPKVENLEEGRKPDVPGNILYIAMILLVMIGFSGISTMKYSWVLLIMGFALAVVFVLVELRAVNPVIQVRIFRKNPVYTLSNLTALLNYGATFAIGYLGSLYLQLIMGYSSRTAGLILIAQPIVMAILSPVAGRWSDRIAPYKLASLGMVFCAIGLLIFAFVQGDWPLWVILVALLVTGIGFALFSSPNTNAVMSCVEKENYGIASSILTTMRSLGHTSGMAIVTLIMGFSMKNTPLSEAPPEVLLDTMHTGFFVFTGLCITGIFMSLKRNAG